jgi:hypothetical protein
MATFSMKRGGKEVGPATTYAQPHTGSSAKVDLGNGYGTTKGGDPLNELKISVSGISGKPYAEPKISGIKMRGAGAATKGVMSRGPMA